MPDRRHVLQATDEVLRAFCISEGVLATDHIFTFKSVDEEAYPFLVCAALGAERMRAKNWKVTGVLSLHTSNLAQVGEADDRKEESDDLETTLLEALEQYIPGDDLPIPLASAIQAAAIDADVISASQYLMTSFYINKVDRDVTEKGNWQFQIDFTASVIA